MTQAEIADFLYGEEMVPVEFVRDCPELGFVVNQDHGSADIPATYRANMPFWLASKIGPEMEENQPLKVEQPSWLRALGRGATLDIERSYKFASLVAIASKDKGANKRLHGLLTERIPDVVTASLQARRRQFDRNDKVFLTEEKEMIANSQHAVEQFFAWKTGDSTLRQAKEF